MCAKLSLGLLFFQLFWIFFLLTSHLVTVFNVAIKPGFHMSGKSQTIGDLLFPDCPRLCLLMKTRNRRYPRSSEMDGDKSGESGAFLFSRRVPDFCDGRRSFPTNENSNLYRRGRRRWISLITNPLSYINIASLGQTCGDYPIYGQNLGRSAKRKIPDRLGFSRHMTLYKTNTSVKRTPRVAPCLSLLPLFDSL